MKLLYKILFLFLVFLGCAHYTMAQTNTVQYGQNRVQYKDFIFSFYESDHFNTYFYQGGQDVGKYAIKYAEEFSKELSTTLDFKYRRKIDLIVYNSINELNQTNIGIYEPANNGGGTTNLPENKLYIYFNGSHEHVDQQIREGLARLYFDKLMSGSSFVEFLQNAVMLSLPDWYRKGFISYVAQPWSSSLEDKLRDGIMSGRFSKLNKLTTEEAAFVGHSLFHYVEEKYGKQSVSNLLYLTRINRSAENGFQFVIGKGVDETLIEWYNFYVARFNNESMNTTKRSSANIIKRKSKKGIDYYQPRLSNDNKHLAFSSNDMGRYKVHLLNTETNKKKTILKGGFRTNTVFTDLSQPLLAWSPNGKELAVIFEKRAVIYLGIYDLEKDKMKVARVEKFQKVLHMNYTSDSKNLVLSAQQNGQSDIFLYKIASTTTTKLTNDYFDDLYPSYIEADSLKGIMFSSNRPNDEIKEERYTNQPFPSKRLDLFFINLDDPGTINQITNTPLADETYAQPFSETEYSFLSDANGISNRYTGTFETVFDHYQKIYTYVDKETGEESAMSLHESQVIDSFVNMEEVKITDIRQEAIYKLKGRTAQVSNNLFSIREQQILPSKELVIELVKQNNKTLFYKIPYASAATGAINFSTDFGKQTQGKATPAKATAPTVLPQANAPAPGSNGTRPFDFQSEFDYGVPLFNWDSANTASSKLNIASGLNGNYVFKSTKVLAYSVKFSVDDIVTQLDNSLIMTRYQPFNPNNPNFTIPPISFGLKFGISDLLENHKLYGGLRLPFSGINGNSEYFITYENLKKRIDKKFTFYRKSLTENDISVKTHYLEADFRYPIDVLQRFGFGAAFRNDKTIYKSISDTTLKTPTQMTNWLFLKADYVFDNTLNVQANIRYGWRIKVFGEIHKEFPFKTRTIREGYDVPLPSINNKWFTVLGLDARHYLKIFRQMIWANRISMGTSLGNSKLIYYLGGVDSWITGKNGSTFDRNTPINTNNGYAFQTLATPLRGFLQNARNGNSYAAINSELRIPVFAIMKSTPLRSEFLKNFTLVAFFDAGTAWEGISPFSDTNPLFFKPYSNSVSTIRVKQYRTPVVFGLGPGFRTSLLGYYLKFDAAWGYDTGAFTKKPVYYFTFGYDF